MSHDATLSDRAKSKQWRGRGNSSDPCQQGIFLHTNAALWVFSQFVNTLCKPSRWLCQCGNPSRSAGCEIVKLTHHLNPLSSRIIRLSHFELQKVTFNTCICLMVLNSCHAIDWLATDGNKQLKFLTDKVARKKNQSWPPKRSDWMGHTDLQQNVDNFNSSTSLTL